MKAKLTAAEARELTDRIRGAQDEAHRLRMLLPPDYTTVERRPSTFTYFIQVVMPNPVEPGPIKIGIAGDVAARMAQLQTGSPFELYLMGYVPGGKKLERELHQKYAHLHLRGEWFRSTEQFEHDLYTRIFDYQEGTQ
jgi:hypothetical protein